MTAVLVWLNYKNAYEYWNEQRLALNKEVQTATQQVFDKLPISSINPSASTSATSFNPMGAGPGTGPGPSAGTPLSGAAGGQAALGTLFLQLTVEDLGICLPMNPLSQVGGHMTTSHDAIMYLL